MTKKSLRDSVATGVVFALFIALNIADAYRSHRLLAPSFIASQFVIFFCYLGWIGLSELLRIGKYRLVRSVQLVAFIFFIAIWCLPSVAARFIVVVLVGATMLMVFVFAMWCRHAGDREI
jgi:hypothetical protein